MTNMILLPGRFVGCTRQIMARHNWHEYLARGREQVGMGELIPSLFISTIDADLGR